MKGLLQPNMFIFKVVQSRLLRRERNVKQIGKKMHTEFSEKMDYKPVTLKTEEDSIR
jgi:hypothetical protein